MTFNVKFYITFSVFIKSIKLISVFVSFLNTVVKLKIMADLVDVVNSSCDEKTLIKTLVKLHSDILRNGKMVCHAYCEKKLVEALVGMYFVFLADFSILLKNKT